MKTSNQNKKILFISTFPPVECGIATYTKDLTDAISTIYKEDLAAEICAINPTTQTNHHTTFTLNSDQLLSYLSLAQKINKNQQIKVVHIQHEFGLFGGEYGSYLSHLLKAINKPVVITFHTVLPHPNKQLRSLVCELVAYSQHITVMTEDSSQVLQRDYAINPDLIAVIAHGTHLIKRENKHKIKSKYNLSHAFVLSTFGLLGPGKSIETAINAIPHMIQHIPNLKYLVLGKTHPNHLLQQNDEYRNHLMQLVQQLGIEEHVIFVDKYLSLDVLLEMLQATDIYLFTSKDPNQAISGTLSYAMSCGCPIIASSVAHSKAVLTSDLGLLFDIQNHQQLAQAVVKLFNDQTLMKRITVNAFQTTRHGCWENTAIKHLSVYQQVSDQIGDVGFKQPKIQLNHLHKLTTDFGIIQFAQLCEPDLNSGYTLDDNARALIVICQYMQLFQEPNNLKYIEIYLSFIETCQSATGDFINYIDKDQNVHIQNNHVNLEDSNARAVWALATLISMQQRLPKSMVNRAKVMLLKCFTWIEGVLSPRSIGFIIKGLYLYLQVENDQQAVKLIKILSDRLITHYDLNHDKDWQWYETYLTYANSVLPEAMLVAYLVTGSVGYKKVALQSLDFLMSKQIIDNRFRTISNQGWCHKDQIANQHGEQSIDVAYSISTLELFYQTFADNKFKAMIDTAFSWYLGNNHLQQVMYNSATGGCYDGLEREEVNINQGAESTLCFLMSQLTLERLSRYSHQTQLLLKQNSTLISPELYEAEHTIYL